MVPSKSLPDFLVGLCSALVGANPLGSSSAKSLSKDLTTINDRVRSEGVSFLTKALPRLAKSLDQALVTGNFCVPNGFKAQRGCSTPAFMQAYFKLIVDEEGLVRDDACPDAIAHLRQVLYFAYKYELPFDEGSVKKVADSFVDTERELILIDDDLETPIVWGASYIVRDIFEGFDPHDIVPKHGPGAVATGERLDEKWTFSRKYETLHRTYPYYDYFMVGRARELADRMAWYRNLRPELTGTAKVVFVPKDSRGPRLISCEPSELQYIQQGLSKAFVERLESCKFTRGRVNFTSQDYNRSLAEQGSVNQKWATLDLKDASDRVSMALVRRLFKHNPRVLECIEAVRSSATVLPDGRRVELSKHAPMGSAMCFPVMAVCCWATIVSAVSRETRASAVSVGRRVYIYGDDIVVPTEWAHVSMQALESVGLRVNKDKSCIQGYFRESCGKDAYKGVDVTPTRVKTPWSGRKSDGNAYVSYIEISNNLLEKGYEDAARYIRDMLHRTYGNIPWGTKLAGYPCYRVNDVKLAVQRNRRLFRSRVNVELQSLEFNVPTVRSTVLDTSLDGWHRLLRNLTAGSGDDPVRVVVPRSTKIKRGWKVSF